MIILDDTKSLSVLASDTSNGLGQIGCINPTITENLNGSYELEFDIATSEKYFSLLHTGGLIKCLHNTSEQIFRIYFISKAINGIVNVKAQHITYDLCGVVVKPFTATGAVSSVNGMLTNVIGTTPFTMTTDITNTTSNFTLDIPRSFRECLGGYEGSLLDVFRGEYEWDNLTVKMLAHRGADNGVRIAYGKNLTDFTQEENIENVFDAVYGYAVIDDVFYQPSGIYNKTGATTPKVKIVDFSSDYESGDTPSQADLYAKAQTYATNNPIEVPNVNIKVSFVPLWQTEEYKNILPLERVSLGDTVHVYFEKLNVEATARVIKTVWNVNLNRYDEIELGDAKANLNTVINESVDSAVSSAISDIDIDTGAIEDELDNLSSLITNGLGLFITKDVLIDGSTRIVLHNKPTLTDSNIWYYIGANGLVVSTDGGSTWNAGFSPDGSAYFNALSANIIKALQIYGSFIRFGDTSSNYIDVSPYSINNVPQGVSFDGTGTVRFQPQNEFVVLNKSSSNVLYNKLDMYKNNAGEWMELLNYKEDGSIGNNVNLLSSTSTTHITMNNYLPSSNKFANYLSMIASSNGESFEIRNGGYDDNGEWKYHNMVTLSNTSTHSIVLANVYGNNYNTLTLNASSGQTNLSTSSNINIKAGGDLYLYGGSSYISMPINGSNEFHSTYGDMKFYASGAIRMYASGGQDIQLQSNDDLLLQCNDKCEITAPNGLYVNGSRIA